MITVEPMDEELEKRMAEYAPAACGTLEDMRGLARDVCKFVEKSGVPQQYHTRSVALLAEIESIEAGVSEYAVNTTEEAA